MRAIALLLLLFLAACARLPGDSARATPAAEVAASGFALLSAHGVPLGSAVAVAPDRLLTNAHVIPLGVERLRFTRGDGAAGGEAVVLGRSTSMDLAVLGIQAGVMRPVPVVAEPPAVGQRLWALGAPSAGPSVVSGVAEQPAMLLPGHGPGFSARIGALMGYSGGPVLDEHGGLRGLVTALVTTVPRADAAPLLAALTGVDLHGLSRGEAGREVFILAIAAALAEAGQIAP